MVTISHCRTKADLREFENLPEAIHQTNPNYVPPFPGSIIKIFDPARTPFKHGRLFPFLASDSGRPVGRIAAIINPSHNEYHRDRTGFFGFFDFIDDSKVSAALWKQATSVLRDQEMERARGPYNPTINDECGLLVEGFETPPMVMMPYNAPYYRDHYERLGLSRVRDLYAYCMSAERVAPERIRKIASRVKRSTGISVRNLNKKELSSELKIIQQLYNRTLDRNWGFVPITLEELEVAAEDLAAIVDPSMVFIAERDGVPAGFSLCLPDINELMLRCRNARGLFRVLKFVWLLKTKRPSRARLAVLGVDPRFRNSGLASLFYSETLIEGKKKFAGGELSWVEESNKEIIRAIELMGGERYKTYQIFEKPL